MKLYQPEYKYISSQILVNNVINSISSYFESGILDETFLYKALKSGLDRIGEKIMPVREAVIVIKDKQGVLPSDFFKAEKVLVSEDIEYWEQSNPMSFHVQERAILEIPACKTTCDYCFDSCGNLFEMYQEFDFHKIKMKNMYSIRVEGGGSVESSTVPSKEFITIQNGKIYANFSGTVYLQYLANLETCDDFLVPDYTQITDWLEALMKRECFEKIYLNGEGDVLQRLQYLENQVREKEQVARNLWKQVEMWELRDAQRIVRNRYSFYKKIHQY